MKGGEQGWASEPQGGAKHLPWKGTQITHYNFKTGPPIVDGFSTGFCNGVNWFGWSRTTDAIKGWHADIGMNKAEAFSKTEGGKNSVK